MASQPIPKPHNPDPKAAAPYCSDPNCEYCTALRRALEAVKATAGRD